MNELGLYFDPLDSQAIGINTEKHNQLGNHIIMHSQDNCPDPEGKGIVLIGIPESRLSLNNKGCSEGPDAIRQYLYKLYFSFPKISITDLGNLRLGKTEEDTYAAVADVISILLERGCVPILIGGSQDLVYANYLAYERLSQIINIVNIDSCFDIGASDEAFSSATYLNRIIMQQPNFLFNFANIGYQTYLNDPEMPDLMKKLFFDYTRLGIARANLEENEPIIRNADLVSLDISSIRQADAPGNAYSSPNGFYGEEACQLCRYAGMSDKLSSFGIYETNPILDTQGRTSHLSAQLIWHFMDGFAQRKEDKPHRDKSSYMKYIVTSQKLNTDIVFYRSPRSDRWWMEVPCPNNLISKYERHYLVPCSYSDYQTALSHDLPDRWWQVYQKLM